MTGLVNLRRPAIARAFSGDDGRLVAPLALLLLILHPCVLGLLPARSAFIVHVSCAPEEFSKTPGARPRRFRSHFKLMAIHRRDSGLIATAHC